MNKRYGVVLIGCGHIGQEHIEDIYFRDNIRVVATVDTREEQARLFARRYGADHYGTDYRPFLRLPETDIVIIATFVTVVEMVMHAFLPDLSDTLGVFISLIVVNCIIFARAEAFAFKNPPLLSAADGLGMGLGFTLAITLLSCIRELLGSGTIFGTRFMPEWFEPMAIAVQPAGGFILLGLTLAAVTGIAARSQKRKEAAK